MENFSVFLEKISIDSSKDEFKESLIEVLCINQNEAEQIISSIPGEIEKNISKPAADALADVLKSIGGIASVRNSLEEISQEEISLNDKNIKEEINENKLSNLFSESSHSDYNLSIDNTFDTKIEDKSDLVLELLEDDFEETHTDLSENTTNNLTTYVNEVKDDPNSNLFEFELEDSLLDESDELSLIDNDEIINSIPETETPIESIIKNDEESLLDLALAFEESKSKLKTVKTVSSNMIQEETAPKKEKVELIKEVIESNKNNELESQFSLEIDESKTNNSSKIEDKKKLHQAINNQLSELHSIPESNNIEKNVPNTLNEVENVSNLETTPTSEIKVKIKKNLTSSINSKNYAGIFLAICLVLFLFYSDFLFKNKKENIAISPEVIQQLIKAQKQKKKDNKNSAQAITEERNAYESLITNHQWSLKTRLESYNQKISSLELNFSVPKVPLPSPEEYIKKEFIPKIASIALSYKNSQIESLSNELTIPSRIYAKIGTKKKRFTVPLKLEFNYAGKILIISSGEEALNTPPGTYDVEISTENPDTIKPKIYFIIPLKQLIVTDVSNIK